MFLKMSVIPQVEVEINEKQYFKKLRNDDYTVSFIGNATITSMYNRSLFEYSINKNLLKFNVHLKNNSLFFCSKFSAKL